jgi:hypothetical protein
MDIFFILHLKEFKRMCLSSIAAIVFHIHTHAALVREEKKKNAEYELNTCIKLLLL